MYTHAALEQRVRFSVDAAQQSSRGRVPLCALRRGDTCSLEPVKLCGVQSAPFGDGDGDGGVDHDGDGGLGFKRNRREDPRVGLNHCTRYGSVWQGGRQQGKA